MRSFDNFTLTLRGLFLLLFALGAPSFADAQPSVRDETGLPGGHRVGWIDAAGPDLSLGARSGYGLIQEATGEGGSHTRLEGALTLSGRPIQMLGIAAGLAGRFDLHPDDALGSDTSGFGKPWLAARFGGALGAVSLGLDARWELFGAEAPSIDFGASRLSLRGLASIRAGSLTVALNAGFRIDGSGSVAGQSAYRSGDSVSLGLNDFNAVLLGLAGDYSFGRGSAYLELTWEPLVGSGAPSIGASALRAGAGARVDLAGGLGAQFGVELAFQSRDPVNLAALVEVEPFLRVFLGLSYTFDFSEEEIGQIDDVDDNDDVVVDDDDPVEPIAARPRVRGVVQGPGGPVAGASVELIDEDEEIVASGETGADGSYEIELPEGMDDADDLRVRIAQSGFEPIVAAADGSPIALTALPPRGSLRGVVRNYQGRPLEATVRVGEREATTDEDGAFELELDAGSHDVVIESSGHRTQNRSVEVDDGGVTVINIDMQRGRSR